MHPVARYRKVKGLTQGALAARLAVHLTAVQRWEKGAEPRPSKLLELARVLEVDPAQLLDDIVSWNETEHTG